VTAVHFLVKRKFHWPAFKYRAEDCRHRESYNDPCDRPTKSAEPAVDAEDPEIEEQVDNLVNPVLIL